MSLNCPTSRHDCPKIKQNKKSKAAKYILNHIKPALVSEIENGLIIAHSTISF